MEDAEILHEIQKLLYYIDNYNNGETEYKDNMIEIANSIIDNTKNAFFYYLAYNFLIIFTEAPNMLINSNLYQLEEYHQTLGYCKEDIAYYLSVSRIIKKYTKKAKKEENYENLDLLFKTSIKTSLILEYISEYFNYINTLASSLNSSYTYIVPDQIKEKRIKNIEEINASISKIMK